MSGTTGGSHEGLDPSSSEHRSYQSMDPPNVNNDDPDAAPTRRRDPVPIVHEDGASDDGSVDMDPDLLLVYGSKQVIRLFVPVSLCMCLVVIVMSSLNYYKPQKGNYMIYTPFHSDNADTGTLVWQSIANALIMLGVIVVMTILLILLYKYRCYKIIHGWLIFTTVLLLFVFSFMFLQVLIVQMNFPLDYITVAFFMWNFGVAGMFAIHWKAPLFLQQIYLITVSVQISLVFIKFLPDWTAWVLLGVISIWDLVAVLCPNGPLRILVETAQSRNEPIMPGLIYSTTTTIMTTDTGGGLGRNGAAAVDDQSSTGDSTEPLQNDSGASGLANSANHREAASALNGSRGSAHASPQASAAAAPAAGNGQGAGGVRIRHEAMHDEDRGVKLGLGDFIFYSVLVGKASMLGDWNTTLACYVAILIGLAFTLLLLAIAGKALPALPISIAFGLVFYFTTSLIITPFSNSLSINQVFI